MTEIAPPLAVISAFAPLRYTILVMRLGCTERLEFRFVSEGELEQGVVAFEFELVADAGAVMLRSVHAQAHMFGNWVV